MSDGASIHEALAVVDVGNSSSCVAVSDNGIVDVVSNPQGERETQSTVAYGKQRVVGGVRSDGHNSTVVTDVNRSTGKRFNDPQPQGTSADQFAVL